MLRKFDAFRRNSTLFAGLSNVSNRGRLVLGRAPLNAVQIRAFSGISGMNERLAPTISRELDPDKLDFLDFLDCFEGVSIPKTYLTQRRRDAEEMR